MRETASSTKTIKLPTEEQTVHLRTITPLMPDKLPSGRIKAIPKMGKLVDQRYATGQVSVYRQQWQRRRQAVLQEEDATIYYEIHKYIQESEPSTLKYEMVIEKAKAHERNCLEYKDHQASHRGANSAPSYNNPLLSAHAINKRRPSGRNSVWQMWQIS